MSAQEPSESHWRLAGTVAFVLLVVGLALGMMAVLGCSENVYPNTSRGEMCNALQERGGLGWWLAVLVPPIFFLATHGIPWFRRHWLLAVVLVVLVMSVGWTYVLLVVSSNIGTLR